MNGSVSRPHSESSGEFSLSLDAEVWSSESSPVQRSSQHNQRRRSSAHANEVLTLHLIDVLFPNVRVFISDIFVALCFLQSGSRDNLSAESPRLCRASDPVQKERTKGRGILRSASGKATPTESRAGRPSLRKAESTRVKGPSQPRLGLSAQAKATSVCERLDASSSSAGLPRASSVISTAEGSTRRSSVHDMLAKDAREPVSVDPSPSKSQAASSEYSKPLPKSASVPCTGRVPNADDPELSTLQEFLGPSFTVDSVFLDSIFSEPAFSSSTRNQAFLSLNTSLVSNISGPPLKPKPNPNHNQPNDSKVDGRGRDNNPDQSAPLSSEDSQSLWYEYGCV